MMMFDHPDDYERVVCMVAKALGITEKEVEKLVDDKIKDLSGLISKEGALTILARQLNAPAVDEAAHISNRAVKEAYLYALKRAREAKNRVDMEFWRGRYMGLEEASIWYKLEISMLNRR